MLIGGSVTINLSVMFRTQLGKNILPGNFSRSFRRIRDKLGFKDWRLKYFRHGRVTILDEINAPLKVRQEGMGHAELKTTMNIYTHTRNRQHKLVVNQLNQALENVIKTGNQENVPVDVPKPLCFNAF